MICSCHQFGGPRAIYINLVHRWIDGWKWPETMILTQPIGEPQQFWRYKIYIYIYIIIIYILWMGAKSCTTLDGWNPRSSGMFSSVSNWWFGFRWPIHCISHAYLTTEMLLPTLHGWFKFGLLDSISHSSLVWEHM